MEAKKVRRSYDLPVNLVNYFKSWKPGRDLSPKVAGAILYFMTLDSDTRDQCEVLAYSEDVKNTLEILKGKPLLKTKIPILPLQPEEKAVLMPDEDVRLLLTALTKNKPNLVLQIISQVLSQAPDTAKKAVRQAGRQVLKAKHRKKKRRKTGES